MPCLQQDNTSHRLLETKEERDLGILVTDRLSVSSQCAEAAKKAMKVLGIIHRQFKDLDIGQGMFCHTLQNFCQTTSGVCYSSLVTLF